ncbi:alpha-amylase family glycosyl hydrolase [Erythrobacter dokdonensis]|uniref:Alpha-amylase family protein n=1 Tax=Erythrobacter dokdonensis DSW-74 TaxID=1300349 RepID=A0A1A7BF84_9SPHN|nr:alpha-amylase family glycosyl hydrolase [Erythrobacter dokdonensis]OBV10406.1 Alpha-amylase family protein [Erythrobacter dokdonensis DSW-74]
MTRIFVSLAAALCASSAIASGPASPAADIAARAPEDEIIYFVLPDRFANGDPANDRGGIRGDRLRHGFDPTHKGFYHGGDLRGLTAKLDYIQGMGVTAIWFAPIFKNKPVQGKPGEESAGYHGYWVTDFTSVDPHFGTNAEFKAFVDAAHSRGMKVYMDIITNHTADVIDYAEGEATGYAYRFKGEYPFSRRGGPDGASINQGFTGDDNPDPANWEKLTDPTFAYTPQVADAEKNVKVPAWLNDVTLYHNRGNSHWIGESSVYGDFSGLDDLATENPRVVAGMIEIFGAWIDDYGIDGFRIDTAKHVNPEFWQAFVPAMLERAKAKGIDHFHIFGEIAYEEPTATLAAQVMAESGLPYALDMGFAKAAQLVASGKAPPRLMAEFLQQDAIYPGGARTALGLPTFLGNHDFGRFAMFVAQMSATQDEDELLARVSLGHALMFLLRGVPTVYYGDEQGFISDGNDQLAREDMFPSKVTVYNDNRLIGTRATTAENNFDTAHPLYRLIADLAKARMASPALRRGLTEVRAFEEAAPGLLAVERHDPASGQRVLLAFNTGASALSRNIEVSYRATGVTPLVKGCQAILAAPGTLRIALEPFGFAACILETDD